MAFLHPALFYRGAEGFLSGTVPFVRDGLSVGEPVAVAVPRHHLRLLRAELGTDVARVRLVDMTEAGRNPGRIIPGVLRAFADEHPGRHVRMIGEPLWAGRSSVEYPACVQHEALINRAFDGRWATVLCPYDAEALGASELADAARTHPWLIDGAGEWCASGEYAPDDVVADYNRELPPPPGAHRYVVAGHDLGGLRRLAAALARQHGLDEDRAEDVVMTVSELASNSVEHGGGAAVILFGFADGQLICQVRDRGRLADPMAGRLPAPLGQERGRGLLLVNQVADLVRVHRGPAGSTVEARFAVSADRV
ncbi:anti-sigma factor RsbA family regulatory protein [Amycolatopsis jejuensis]|uniref:anti-sigma factor RsbA family regulatory protein n=1 Tax=Amycolatopsis jejuensis TaxID=330084 RepID=UPI0005275A0C|nr:anti-sigma factor RsbA family regulatory protein [Amycolatopsis jejuensis]